MCKTKLIQKENVNAVEIVEKGKKFIFFCDELDISEEEILQMSDGERNQYFSELLKKKGL